MDEAFDVKKFEELQGGKLGLYAANLVKTGHLPPDCLEFFRKNATRWDGQHLETGLYFLSKISSTEARHEIVDYIEHPLKHIRYTVLSIIDHLNQFDDYTISKIAGRVPSVTDSFEKKMVEHLHKKAIGQIED